MRHFTIVGLALVLTLLAGGTAPAANYDGFTEPYRKIDVAAAEMGVINKLMVKEGDRVVAGQTLAALDSDVLVVSREIAATNRDARGKIQSAQAEVELRQWRLARVEPLHQQGHASQEEIDRVRTELAVAVAGLMTAREQNALDTLECRKIEAMIERRMVRSPIDGVVIKLHKEEQEFVSNTSAVVATVVQISKLRAVFAVPTAAALALKPNQTVSLELPETREKLSGKVEYVAPVTDADSGTVRVKVAIDNAEGRYRCGVRCALDTKDAGAEKDARPLRPGASYVQ